MRGQGSRSERSGENFSHSHRSGGRDAADCEAKQKARAGISGRLTPRASSSSRTERRFRDKMGGKRKASKADILEESNEGKVQLNAVAVEDAEKQQGQIEALTRQMQNITQPTAVPEPTVSIRMRTITMAKISGLPRRSDGNVSVVSSSFYLQSGVELLTSLGLPSHPRKLLL